MDEILYPSSKPSRRKHVNDGSGELFPEVPKAKPAKSMLPMPTLLVPHGTKGKLCGCGVTIYLVEQPSGRYAPITCSTPGGVVPSAATDGLGINHRIDCVQSNSYPRRR